LKRIIVDKNKCSGCRYCELICSYRDNLVFNPRNSRIRVLKYDELGIDDPTVCRQCAECPPIDLCPTQAFRRDKDNIVRIEENACNICYVCVDACPHGAVFRPPTQRIPLVCDLCNGEPLCVKKCPTHAITFSTKGPALSPRDFEGRAEAT